MDFTRVKKTILNSTSSFLSHRIRNAVLYGVAIYIAITFVFGFLYHFYNALDFRSASGINTFHFLDYIYFSAVTFTTIGYGDIVPKAGVGLFLVLIESCLELIYFPVFGGYIALSVTEMDEFIFHQGLATKGKTWSTVLQLLNLFKLETM